MLLGDNDSVGSSNEVRNEDIFQVGQKCFNFKILKSTTDAVGIRIGWAPAKNSRVCIACSISGIRLSIPIGENFQVVPLTWVVHGT